VTRPTAHGGDRGGSRLLGSLASLSFAVQSAFDTRSLVNALAPHVLEIARAEGFALFLVDYETGELAGQIFEKGGGPGGVPTRILPKPEDFLGRVLRREALVVAAADSSDGGPYPWPPGTFPGIVGVPVLVGTSLLGVAVLGYRRPVVLTSRRRRALLYLADQIGLAVERLRSRSDIEAKTRQLEDARAALRKIEEAKSDLISIVSHELRTPLTAIKAYTETLLDNADSSTFPMHRKFLSIIDEECDRLSRMVNDVLDLSRMDSGRTRLHAAPVSLARMVEEVVPTVEPGLVQRELSLRVRIDPDLPHLEADLDLLKQVLVNLIHNAVKFSRPGGNVTVTGEAAGDRIHVAVEDQGQGIPSDQIERVFDRFYRVESESGERVSGTGLGLAIVKRVIELHGGSVRVESELGVGTRFILDLPREQRGFRSLIQSLAPFFEQPEMRALLQHGVEMIAEVMDAGIVSILFFNEDASELVIQAAHGLDADMVARTRVRTGDSIAGWVAQSSENLLVQDIELDRRFRKMNHPQYETKSLLCVPLRIAGETVGVVNVNNKRTGVEFDADDLGLLVAVVKRVGIAFERIREDATPASLQATLGTVRAIVRARRNHLLPSSRRAFKLAVALGRRVGLEADDVDVLGYVVRVHDVGMLAVDDSLLLAARRWSPDERRDVESHPQAGVQMLKSIEFESKVNEIILGHHEHWDGHGYPRGLQREQIPLAARVLAVVDAFEAMTSGRPYREPLDAGESVAELRRCAGTQFDPRVVDEFARVLAEQAGSDAPDAALARGAGSGAARGGGWRSDAVR
jgi:signal transduction histidine kinase/HD-GYP domain-containing protein (c-di-GMP phosphodiesterase class II)